MAVLQTATRPGPAPRTVCSVGDTLRGLLAAGDLDLPRPACGQTDRRWAALAAVTVVLDRCTDETPSLVAAELADWPEAAAVHLGPDPGQVGGSGAEPADWSEAAEYHRRGLGSGVLVGCATGLAAAGAGPGRTALAAPAPVGPAPAPGPAPVVVVTGPGHGAIGLGPGRDAGPVASAVPNPDPAPAGAAGAAQRRRPSGVGWIRDVGVRHLLGRLRPHAPETTWLLSTDADTTVPQDWATAHLWFAAGGAHGVAGLADLRGAARLSADVVERYAAVVAGGLHGDWHDHVYAANLGFRADAYLAVGGFPIEDHGEEHGLWRRMGAAGYRLMTPTEVRVRTSARIRGRATGGLADLLRSMHRPPLGRGGA